MALRADAAEWIGGCALPNCAKATLCQDPFDIVRWATYALDVVRRWVSNTLRKVSVDAGPDPPVTGDTTRGRTSVTGVPSGRTAPDIAALNTAPNR